MSDALVAQAARVARAVLTSGKDYRVPHRA